MMNSFSKVWNDCPLCGKPLVCSYGGYLHCSSNHVGYSHYLVSYLHDIECAKVAIHYDRLKFIDEQREYRIERHREGTVIFSKAVGAPLFKKAARIKSILPIRKIDSLDKIKILLLFS